MGNLCASIDDGDGSVMEAELIKERHQSSEQLKVHMQMLWNQYDVTPTLPLHDHQFAKLFVTSAYLIN